MTLVSNPEIPAQTPRLELAIDIETYSSVDIKNGAYAYAGAPDFEILLIAYTFSDEDDVQVIDLASEADDTIDLLIECHSRFMASLENRDVIKTAFNANFERTCLSRWLQTTLPPEEWRCTQILAVQLGLPRALAAVGPALGLPEDQLKLKTGKALIQYFCKPCRPTKSNGGRTRNMPGDDPDKWRLFVDYNRQDVVTEQAILERLRAFRPDEHEQALWSLDQTINDRGVRLDIPMARNIVEYDTGHGARLIDEARDLTGLDNPNSLAQLKDWLHKNGCDVGGLTKSDVAELLAGQLPGNVRRVLEIRQQLGKTSVKKYQTMLDIAGTDGRARGVMQFYGGHTGRWAGRSLQPQNLARNSMPDADLDEVHGLAQEGDFEAIEMLYGNVSEVFSQLVRTAFIPSDGCRFVVSDFSAIEARVIAWLAGEQWRLDVFRNDGDIYCESASHIYHVPVVKHGINGELRQRGKVAELALGYGGGVGAMKSMDTTGSVPESEMQGIVAQWRAESPRIVAMWRACQNAAVAVITGRARHASILDGKVDFRIEIAAGTPVLRIYLPNGRPISFWAPRVDDGDMGPRISYMNQNQTTRKWERTETYGGKLTENIVQSVARDCLAEKMMKLEHGGYPIVFHVHDEIIFDVPRIREGAFSVIDRIMAEPIGWAEGLPLKGGTYECDFYRKD